MRERALAAVVIALTTLVGFGAAELVARVAHDRPEDGGVNDSAHPYILSPELGWERRPSFTGMVEGGYREYDSRGVYRIDSAQIEDTLSQRVFVLGGSTTFGYAVGTESTYTEVLEDLLPGVSGINLGTADYTSYQGKVLLKRLSRRFLPSLVIAEFGLLDRNRSATGSPDGPEQFAEKHGGAVAQVARILLTSQLVRYLQRGLYAIGVFPSGDCVPLDSLKPRVDTAEFRANLREISAIAGESQSRVLFLHLGASPLGEGRFRRAEALVSRGANDSAIAALRPIVANPRGSPHSVMSRALLIRALLRSGQTAAADSLMCVSAEVESAVRPESTYVRIMREVADETDGELVDFRQSDRLPGDYIDEQHLSSSGHRKLARFLTPFVRRALDRQNSFAEGQK